MKKISTVLLFTIFAFQLQAQTFADLVESVKPSVVKIHVLEKKNLGIGNPNTFTAAEGFGSGVGMIARGGTAGGTIGSNAG